MATKVDKNRTAGSPLSCCQSNDSLTSRTSNLNEDVNICEAMNNFVKSPLKKPGSMVMPSSVKRTFPKREPVNLTFENVKFNATQWTMKNMSVKRDTSQILHGVSGEFKSGELTVIMGPSGAGKSTLLNGLAGYITKGFSGTVKYNEEIRNENPRFKKLVAYIPQDEELRLHLTVMENMMIAVDLKLGYSVSSDYKLQQVQELLEILGLERTKNTMTSRLSGGQRKRLAIALELLSNPPILFLDEPTTGLDSLSCSQCIALLKKLAHEGRTVICTIHQPSALLFEMFDHLYVLSAGKCIYDGDIKGLLPHLSSVGLECPSYHNPADFLMEVAIGEHGVDLDNLSHSVASRRLASVAINEKEILSKKSISSRSIEEIAAYTTPNPANSLMQFLLLYKRNLMISRRQYSLFFNRFIAHVAIGLLFGYLYRDVGANANTVLANYVYLYGSLLLVVYTGQMSVTLSFPLEIKVLCREHFNRWFKLPPYLMSVLLLEVPFQVLCTWTYIAISYWMTGQLADYRLYFFVIFCTLGTLCAQAMGYLIGSISPISVAVFVGPVLACLFSVFGFCIRYIDTPLMFRWMYHISYFRASFHGLMYSIYGFPRNELYCPEELIYCHYAEPTKFLKEMDVGDINLWSNMTLVVFITFLVHASTYISLWVKLNKR